MSNKRKNRSARIEQGLRNSEATPAQRAGDEPYTLKQHKRNVKFRKLDENQRIAKMDALYADMLKQKESA